MKEDSRLRNKEGFCSYDGVPPRGIFGWIDFYQKNKPQTNALSAGIMLMIFGGSHIGWGIFNNHLRAQPWAGGYEDEGEVFWAIICFFVAGIIGFFTAGVLVHKFSKISIYVSFQFSFELIFLNIFLSSLFHHFWLL